MRTISAEQIEVYQNYLKKNKNSQISNDYIAESKMN